MTALQSFATGIDVWIPDEEEVFVEGNVVRQDGDNVTVKLLKPNGKQVVVRSSECFSKDRDVVEDMTKLVYLHEAGVLHNLNSKYLKDEIYTYTGNILIAVNPFKRIPEMYDASVKAKYQKARIGDLPPHIFAVSDTAYRAMLENRQSQSILISGESGAGKTETTKLVMEYLAGVGGRAKTSGRSVESQVLESNPLLEAFGNAKTVRNNNSSRFGKYIQIQFNKFGRVSGASIKSYLLERSRVVNISPPERNYHCFYQLCYGASPEEAEKYMLPSSLKRAQTFHYLNQSDCFLLDKVDNAEEFRITKNAMNVLGFSVEEQDSIWQVVSAVLHLGNVRFTEAEDHNEALQPADVASKEHLDTVAQLLKCDRVWLEKTLVHKFRKISGELVASRLDVKGAINMRDSLAKNLYSKLFDWIVDKVNVAIGEDYNSEISIGVLDIYGFEHFKHNSFEQFCINLANEKLQQHFNMHVLKMEQEEYEREAINWSRIPFSDNQDSLDIIEKDKGSILSILDADSKLGTKTAEGFTRTLQKEFGDHKRFSMAKTSRTDFTLEHYAGKVKYSTEEFLVKNVDAVVPEHHRLLSESKNTLLREMFPEGGAVETGNQFTSLGLSFKRQLAELMVTLNQTSPHYVRCVKPNSKLKPRIFERQLAMTQLRSGGVLEAVRMCSAGYPTRRTFADFLERFWVVAGIQMKKGVPEKKLCEQLMQRTGLSDYQIGLTKIFLRAGQMVALDTLLSNQNKAAACIQHHIKLYWFIRERRGACMALQTWWRRTLAKRAEAALRKALTGVAMVLQKNIRMKAEREHFLALKHATKFLQGLVRKRLERNLEMAYKIRQGVDRKTSSRAESVARAKLDHALDLIARLESEVDSKAQELVSVQSELNAARVKATEYAQAVEKITGEREPVLDSLLMADAESDEGNEEAADSAAMSEMEERMQELQNRLAAKELEVRMLTRRLSALPSLLKMPELPADQQQSILLEHISSLKFGFSPSGVPVAAAMVYKSLLHWNTFSAERTNTFDRIVETFQLAARNSDNETLAYWLANTAALYGLVDAMTAAADDGDGQSEADSGAGERPNGPGGFLDFFGRQQQQKEQQKEEEERRKRERRSSEVHVDTLMFKLQLGTSVERLYVTMRDAIKADLQACLFAAAAAAGGGGMAGSAHSPANGRGSPSPRTPLAPHTNGALPPPSSSPSSSAPSAHKLLRFPSSLRAQVSNTWQGVVDCLKQALGDLRAACVPPLIVHFLLKQLLAFINTKVFNGLMVRSSWCPCTYSNGVAMGEGLAKLLAWLATEVDFWLQDWLGADLPPLGKELAHVQQAVFFLLIDDKPEKTIDEIKNLCPVLSMNQLVHICIWYEDDKHGHPGVEPGVIELMWALMVEDSPMLLRDDDSIPFTIDDVIDSMDELDLSDVETPAELLECGLHFLIPKTSV